MPGDRADLLTPAEVAELLGIPPSTLRTYAAAFGRLLSRDAQGDSSVEGRAFRHRRYSQDDLVVLTRAKSLLDAGMSYRLALAHLLGGGAMANVASEPQRSRTRPSTLVPRRGADRVGSGSRRTDHPPVASLGSTPTPPEVRVERVVETIVDTSAVEAVDRLGPILARLLEGVEAQSARISQLEGQVDALRTEICHLQSTEGERLAAPKPWYRRLFGS
jgi:hypothetical protein